MKPVFTNKLRESLGIVAAWIVAVYLYQLAQMHSEMTVPVLEIDDFRLFLYSLGPAASLGMLNAFVELFFIPETIRKFPFAFLVFAKTGIFLIGFIFISVFFVLVFNLFPFEIAGASIQMTVDDAVRSDEFVVNLIFATLMSLGINYVREINVKMGGKFLTNIIFGKYRTPSEVTRIFMFLDAKSSTTIAESLEPIEYSELVKDLFYDLSGPIYDSGGEIYQYVGDEIVAVWTPGKGLRRAACVRSFFKCKKVIEKRKEYYLDKYFLCPEFKAGLNIGKAIATEIGRFKREIVFHGNTLNVASRIQNLCNELGEEILISGDLRDNLDRTEKLRLESLGFRKLKGKKKEVEIVSVRESSE